VILIIVKNLGSSQIGGRCLYTAYFSTRFAKSFNYPRVEYNLATVILCGGLRAEGIDEVCDLGSTNLKLGQGLADAVQRHARLPSRADRLARPG
jgi:hypothetical protein